MVSATGDLVDKIKDLDPDDDIGREMVEYSGFVAGDTSADLDVEPLLTTTATANNFHWFSSDHLCDRTF